MSVALFVIGLLGGIIIGLLLAVLAIVSYVLKQIVL